MYDEPAAVWREHPGGGNTQSLEEHVDMLPSLPSCFMNIRLYNLLLLRVNTEGGIFMEMVELEGM